MPFSLSSRIKSFDITLFFAILFVAASGLVTMSSFGQGDTYFYKQGILILLALVVYFFISAIDFRFLKQTRVVTTLYASLLLLLALVHLVGHTAKGAQNWFSFAGFSFQPSDLMKLVLIIVLAKYFSRRHIEIANVRHIIVSAIYALLPFLLIVTQPDLGSAIIIVAIWFGMVLISGISKKHLFAVLGIGLLTFLLAWNFVFKPYQKARIMNFIYPLQDIRGTGYNAYQSTIAVGSGGLLGKGLGYGTQSRLNFLPEYKTDFIFAAFAEEWGFVGALLLFVFYGVIFYKLARFAVVAETNFEALFTYGVIIWFVSHIIINVGMNIGLMPVTGIPLPLMSYGGSHLLSEGIALGMCLAMRRYARAAHKSQMKNEFLGLE